MSTDIFLEDRSSFIKDEINQLEIALQNIKKGNDVFNIEAINSIFSNQKIESTEMIFNLQTQELLANSFLDQLKKYKLNEFLPIPFEIGIANPEISTYTQKFNDLVLERNKLLQGRTSSNTQITLISKQLDNLILNLNESVKNYLLTLSLQYSNVLKYDDDLDAKFYKLNDTEITLLKFTRELEVKSGILLFLLEKQEENSLKLAVNSPTFKVLELSHTNFAQKTPNNSTFLALTFLLSLILPFAFFYLRDLFYDKISDKKSLEKRLNSDIPFLGEIPETDQKIISAKNRAPVLESFRLLRTNLNFIDSPNKCILVTSGIKGDLYLGKK